MSYDRKNEKDIERIRRSIVTLPLSNSKKKMNPAFRSNSFSLKDFKPSASNSVAKFAQPSSLKNDASLSEVSFSTYTEKLPT